MSDNPPTTDPLETPLPCDVRCGSIRFSKGVPLRILVEAATRWRALATKALPTPPEEAVAAFHESVRAFNEAVDNAE